jgi:D-glycero-D-manno-heptose 1,7-bisphosphate phosphatase
MTISSPKKSQSPLASDSSPQKAIFLDRDGTLIVDKNYLYRVEDISYYPETFEALKLMQTKGYALYIITNQSGVGRGFFTIKEVELVHKTLQEDLRKSGLQAFKGIGVCPHLPEDLCECRKPHPKMILDFIQQDKLQPEACWMIGDKVIDAETGKRAKIQAALVRPQEHSPDFPIFKNLLDFARSLP